jgi:hypothetical protein
MLFLAVTLGFFVENLREHYLDGRKEIQFARSFAADLKRDIYELDSLIRKREQRKVWIDSLTLLLQGKNPDEHGADIYFYARYLPRPYVYFSNDATLKQLRNSGNFRLIEKQLVVDTMIAYDQQIAFIERIRDREEFVSEKIFTDFAALFDSRVFDQMTVFDIEFVRPPGNPHLKTKSPAAIDAFLSNVHLLKTLNGAHIGWFRRQKAKAEATLKYIIAAYSLQE